MDKEELLRLVDSLHRDKNIDTELIFQGIEAALTSAARRHFVSAETISVKIDRTTGEIIAYEQDRRIDPSELGRISAQTAKQVIIQKIRDAERDAIYEEYAGRKGTIVSGTVQRFEGSTMIINLGRVEGFMPKSEQIANELYHPGERVRAIILDTRKVGSKVKITLSRNHQDFVRKLFELEVPEIGDDIIEVKALAREAGYRTKIAVNSKDANVDSVGACVGVRGSRIKNIVDELGGEKIDIVRWSEAPEDLIPNTLKPAEVSCILLATEERHVTVVVPEDQLSLAIGKKGQNVRLAAKLTQWDIDIVTEAELQQRIAEGTEELEAAKVSEDESIPSDDTTAAEKDVAESGKLQE
ncbi:MAG: transcription termination factor NusA [Candidatus Brocadiales bacterium]